MGHRFSKTAAIRQNEVKRKSIATQKLISSTNTQELNSHRHSLPIPTLLGPAINFQIEESPTTTNRSYSSCSNNSLTSVNTNNGARQIIIKIQLAKMENGNDTTIRLEQVQETPTTTAAAAAAIINAEATSLSDRNSNSTSRTAGSSVITTASPTSTALRNNSSSSLHLVTSNEQTGAVTYNELVGHINAMQLADIDELQQTTSRTAYTVAMAGTTASRSSIIDNEDLEEYCEVLEDAQGHYHHNANNLENPFSAGIIQTHLCEEALLNTNNNNNNSNTSKCCNRKSRNSATTNSSSSASSNSSSSTTGTTTASRRRCCKCTCRDALRRLMEPKYYKNKQAKVNNILQQQQQQQQTHSTELQWAMSTSATTSTGIATTPYPIIPAEAIANLRNLPVVPATTAVAATALTAMATTNASGNVNVNSSQLSIWASNPHNRQFVVVSCPPTSVLTVGRVDDNSIHLMATEDIESMQVNNNNNNNSTVAAAAPAPVPTHNADVNNSISQPTHAGPTVHSQVDYMHCLVPDLEKITNSSFYWGKMDRYEAERLLEGKPEGTFLLRDSAQEEFLFSVTFRKYGRSLHARIEQSGHKFSFDCHDPCVFTAPTVTGLLEHYKDPSCVMFFEPMLTIPLHRKTTFSLQQLCRATIVSNITYDGINKLELPLRLKSYLKEYHYKQKLRIKPMDDPLYSCT